MKNKLTVKYSNSRSADRPPEVMVESIVATFRGGMTEASAASVKIGKMKTSKGGKSAKQTLRWES